MGFINLAERTINAKLVYYGCGMGGKTTSLQVVHRIMCPRNEVDLVSIKTEQDATLLFDFLPIDLGEIDGFKVRIQGFTVPGQPKYKRMRKYVLQGADAVVFVVDSERSRLEENRQSFQGLRENLEANGIDPDEIPIVLQYNKRDLEDVLTEAELDDEFRDRKSIQSYPSIATDGHGVYETFVQAAGELVEAKVRLYRLDDGVSPEQVADGAREKLWEIYDASGFALGGAADPEHLELSFDDNTQPVFERKTTGPAAEEDPFAGFGDLGAVEDPFANLDLKLDEPGTDDLDFGGDLESPSSDDEAALPGLELDDGLHTGEDPGFGVDDEVGNPGFGIPGGQIRFGAEKQDEEPAPFEANSAFGTPGVPAESEHQGTLDNCDLFPTDDLIEPLDFDRDPIPLETPEAPQGSATSSIDDEEPVEELLNATVTTNLELARKYGELDRRCALLQRRNEELVRMSQDALHDLRRPLTALKLILSSMGKGVTGELSDRGQEAVRQSLNAVEQMERLSDDLVDSTRLDFDGMEFDFEPVELGQLVSEVLGSMQAELQEARAEVVVRSLPEVVADRWALQRVLTNLVANSLQYRADERPLKIEISARVEQERTVLEIGDNGIGIPADDRDRLFKRFQRGSNTSGRKGSGLGLHIIREAILGHGGSVWLRSTVDEGTVFSLALPKEPQQPPHDVIEGVAEQPVHVSELDA